MSTYLDLVNKVIQESNAQIDELTSGTWSDDFSGRQIYPRIKRNVADAWKMIQMKHNDWEFMSGEVNTTVYPRIAVINASRTGGAPSPGTQFEGLSSGFVFTVVRTSTIYGTWAGGDGSVLIDFTADSGTRMTPNETFNEIGIGDGTFTYLEKGSYNFFEDSQYIKEFNFSTFVGFASNISYGPIRYIPWDNWLYRELNFVQTSTAYPLYLSQDPAGNIVFYPQSLRPFTVTFVYSLIPQVLSAWDDEPSRIPDMYHEWIAWEALKKLAMYDKNPDLFAHAVSEAKQYWNSAETNLMPIPSWAPSEFNRG